MSKHSEHTQHGSEKGTKVSYVVGFILSLIFTAIAYVLVINKSLQGSALLGTILTLAVLQMFVQIFFFLHLGRGPKPLYNIFFFASTVFLILVVVIGSIFIMDNLHYTMAPAPDTVKNIAQNESITQVEGEETGACRRTGVNHNVTIKNGLITPRHTQAKLCDTITFINQDKEVREMTFGVHPEHQSYGGIEEIRVYKGYNKTMTLNTAGQHLFHDHNNPATAGSFEVE